MNELQDGRPRVWLNPEDAAEKGIEEGDYVEIFNDREKSMPTQSSIRARPGKWLYLKKAGGAAI
jgi:anaerobic selenocysteine-containing dehydrogenase